MGASFIRTSHLCRLFSLLLLAIHLTQAFIYDLDFKGVDEQILYTEYFMFGTNQGPYLHEKGESSIQVDGIVDFGKAEENPSQTVAVACFRSDNVIEEIPSNDFCKQFDSSEYYELKIQTFRSSIIEVNGESREIIEIKSNCEIKTSGLQYSILQRCSGPSKQMEISGTITFHNPYGYLPGSWFGYLPFEGFRMVLFFGFLVFYTFMCYRFRDNMITLHKFIFLGIFLALFESICAFISYIVMNKDGIPVCCPFPKIVIVSLILKVITNTSFRGILLTICVGFGTTKSKLEKKDILLMGSALLTFFILSIFNEIEIIKNSMRKSSVIGAFATITDFIIISWIYLSLVKTMKQLHAEQQTFKLQMFEKLAKAIIGTIFFFTILTVIIIMTFVGSIKWAWDLLWIQTVQWEILNFVIFATICFLWRPSDKSHLLAYSAQIPTSEEDSNQSDQIEMTQNKMFHIIDDDREQDDEEEDEEENYLELDQKYASNKK